MKTLGLHSIRIIAQNTFREIIRDRILYGIVVFALLLFGLSLALGGLSFSEQARISANFGFAGIQLGASILAVFVGSTLVAREIEKQTILTLLARPVTRSQFIVGKYIGLALVILAVMTGLALVLALQVFMLELPMTTAFVVAIFGILLEAYLLMSLALFFGSFARPMMTVVFTLSFFLIGHWVSTLGTFIEKSKSPEFKIAAGAIAKVVPDLERFNWRAAPVYSLAVPLTEIVSATLYAFGWIIVLLTATSIIFRRRDFV